MASTWIIVAQEGQQIDLSVLQAVGRSEIMSRWWHTGETLVRVQECDKKQAEKDFLEISLMVPDLVLGLYCQVDTKASAKIQTVMELVIQRLRGCGMNPSDLTDVQLARVTQHVATTMNMLPKT